MVALLVLFRVEVGVLDGQRQGAELGEKLFQHGEAEILLQSRRGPRRLEQQPEQFVGDALGAELGQRHLARLGVDRLVHGEAVDRGEAGGAQDAQRVVAEARRRGHGHPAPGDGLQPLVRVDHRPVAEAHGDGVAGEVATPEVLFQGDLGAGLDEEVLVAVGRPVLFALAARHGDIVGLLVPGELDHREALADRVGLAEGRQPGGDLVVAHAGDQQVDVLAGGELPVKDPVADRAAHHVHVVVEDGDEKVLPGESDLQPLHDGCILAVPAWEVNSPRHRDFTVIDQQRSPLRDRPTAFHAD